MFDGIKGQKYATNLLMTLIKGNRFPHALLFYGEQGIGKFLTAKSIVKFFNCKNTDLNLRGNDNCNICRRIENENFPDFYVVRREITETKTKKIKIAKEIKLDQIKKVIQQTNLKSFESNYKFYIIEDADMMNIESANALLKTLEEPRPNNYLILIAGNINKILDTILSRCVKIKFNNLSIDIIKDIIHKKYSIDEEVAEKLALVSNGSMYRAQLLIENDNYKTIFELFNKLIKLFGSSNINIEQLGNITDNMISAGNDYIKIILELLLVYFNDVYLLNKYEIGRKSFFKKVLNLKNKNIHFKKYNEMLDNIVTAKYELTNTNINVSLLLKNLFIKIKEMIDGSI